jgi:hypothetical protein
MGRITEHFSNVKPVAIASAKLMEHHSSALTHQWMKSVEHWPKFQKKEAFAVLLDHLVTIRVRYVGG